MPSTRVSNLDRRGYDSGMDKKIAASGDSSRYAKPKPRRMRGAVAIAAGQTASAELL